MISYRKQHTIKSEVTIEGIGLFTGKKSTIKIKSAPENTGIVFLVKNSDSTSIIKLELENILYKNRRTILASNGCRIDTVEHLLAAITYMDIDNAYIEVEGPEIPVLDGSSMEFVNSLESAGLVEQNAQKPIYTLQKPVYYQSDGASIVALPHPSGLKITYTLEYKDLNPPFSQSATFEINRETFKKEIASARTFSLRKEAEEILKSGEGLGGNLNNTLILDDVIQHNRNGYLRFYDEPVRHKILDLLGDISALNIGLHAHIIAVRSGHRSNLEFLRKLREIIQEETRINAYNVLNHLPHRFPFLMIDRILEIQTGKSAKAIKNISINEPYFQGHFPAEPIMPGVLQIEAMAQLGGAMFLTNQNPEKRKYPILLAMHNVKLRKIIRPGDQLIIEVETIKLKDKWATIKGICKSNSKITAEAEITFMFLEKVVDYGNS
jgi:UDP-3-O-[3-hydroxymyristoyl] N-acetylglucosamine deacetylase/3-hydroxyacyl-[acyl-carrier-protein] dehydratase